MSGPGCSASHKTGWCSPNSPITTRLPVGIVTGLQFAPQLLLLPWTGLAADRFNQRKLLILTQAAMGVLATALGILTISGHVRLWHVYVFAFVFGAAAALDAPVRQTFVAELVGDQHLPKCGRT